MIDITLFSGSKIGLKFTVGKRSYLLPCKNILLYTMSKSFTENV